MKKIELVLGNIQFLLNLLTSMILNQHNLSAPFQNSQTQITQRRAEPPAHQVRLSDYIDFELTKSATKVHSSPNHSFSTSGESGFVPFGEFTKVKQESIATLRGIKARRERQNSTATYVSTEE